MSTMFKQVDYCLAAPGSRVERFQAQPGQQLECRVGVQGRRPHDGAETAGVGEPQRAERGVQVEVVVGGRLRDLVAKGKGTGHAQVHQ